MNTVSVSDRDLAPCACGSIAHITEIAPKKHVVDCKACGASTGHRGSSSEALTAWGCLTAASSRRTSEPQGVDERAFDTQELRETLTVYAQNHGQTGEEGARYEVLAAIAETVENARDEARTLGYAHGYAIGRGDAVRDYIDNRCRQLAGIAPLVEPGLPPLPAGSGVCGGCGGSGFWEAEVCSECGGAGKVKDSRLHTTEQVERFRREAYLLGRGDTRGSASENSATPAATGAGEA